MANPFEVDAAFAPKPTGAKTGETEWRLNFTIFIGIASLIGIVVTLAFSVQTHDKVNNLSSKIDDVAVELRGLSGDILQTLLESTVQEPLGATITQQGVSHFIGMKILRIMGTSEFEFQLLPNTYCSNATATLDHSIMQLSICNNTLMENTTSLPDSSRRLQGVGREETMWRPHSLCARPQFKPICNGRARPDGIMGE